MRVNYFDYPTIEVGEDETLEYESEAEVILDIQETIINEYPEFIRSDVWVGREDHVILEGYGVQIGLSAYGTLASLSVRVDPNLDEQEEDAARTWIKEHWENASKYYDQFRKIGTFSNGESIYELKK